MIKQYQSILFIILICGSINAQSDHEIAIEVKQGVDPVALGNKHGLEHIGQVGYLKDHHVYKKSKFYSRDIHPHVSENEDVIWWENQVPRQLHKRQWDEKSNTHTDPLYGSQWHLNNKEYGVNAQEAWDFGYTGKGVVVSLVDDGLQREHPDIVDNYQVLGSVDINSGTIQNPQDPVPRSGDNHGTSAAGLAAARDNRACGVGSAFRAKLTGIRLISRATTDSEESMGIAYMHDVNDIYSNSWGPNDDGKRLEGPGVLATKSIELAMKEGRRGLGSIYVWAAGNGRSSGDNCNYDGWANSRYTISIPAVDIKGNQAYYSESCSANLVTAPSSGSGTSITTSDLLGKQGTSPTECTSTFGGTSAAAPLAAGVVALVLEANTNLTWRDVQYVLINSARPFSTKDSGWAKNGRGYNISHKFGFGMIDAGAAVKLAEKWVNVEPVKNSTIEKIENIKIPDNKGEPKAEGVIVVDEDFYLEHVEVFVSIKHPHRGDLRIKLISPQGTVSVLGGPRSDTHPDYPNWRMMTVFCWGEHSKGVWKLQVIDEKPSNTGTLDKWTLRLWGPHGGREGKK